MNEVGVGVVTGGWPYVTAAYVVSLVILGGYVASVVWRYRVEKARRERESGTGRS